jgi:hypothetical protein
MKNSLETLRKRNALKKMWKNTIDPASFPHQIERRCKGCGELKMCDWLSSFTQTGKPEYRVRCKECHNALQRKRSKNRWATIVKKKVERQRIVKQKCVDYLGGKCVRCGYNKSIRALTFHHRDRKEKERCISLMIVNNSFEKIQKELDKCDLVCFNCHMEIEEEIQSKLYKYSSISNVGLMP